MRWKQLEVNDIALWQCALIRILCVVFLFHILFIAPDEQINPKKKIFEQIQVQMYIDRYFFNSSSFPGSLILLLLMVWLHCTRDFHYRRPWELLLSRA